MLNTAHRRKGAQPGICPEKFPEIDNKRELKWWGKKKNQDDLVGVQEEVGTDISG